MHLFFEVQIDVHFNSLSSYTVGFKGMCMFFEVQIDVHFNSLSSYTVGFKGMCICFLKFRLTFILTLCLPILPVSKECASVF